MPKWTDPHRQADLLESRLRAHRRQPYLLRLLMGGRVRESLLRSRIRSLLDSRFGEEFMGNL